MRHSKRLISRTYRQLGMIRITTTTTNRQSNHHSIVVVLGRAQLLVHSRSSGRHHAGHPGRGLQAATRLTAVEPRLMPQIEARHAALHRVSGAQ